MLRRSLRLSVIAVTVLSAGASNVWACPMCKMALETDDPKPRAYMVSILFMLGMMTVVSGSVVGLLCWLSRHEKAALDAAGYQHLFENGVTEHAMARAK